MCSLRSLRSLALNYTVNNNVFASLATLVRSQLFPNCTQMRAITYTNEMEGVDNNIGIAETLFFNLPYCLLPPFK